MPPPRWLPPLQTDAVEPIARELAEARDDLVAVKDVWDCAQLCELQFTAWRETLWKNIRTDKMEEGAKGFVKEVKALSRKVRVAAQLHAQYP